MSPGEDRPPPPPPPAGAPPPGAVAAAAASARRNSRRLSVVTGAADGLENLTPEVQAAVQACWALFLQSTADHDAAGEALLAGFLDAAPLAQGMFRTARPVAAQRLLTGLGRVVACLGDAKALQCTVETLAFQHMDLEVTLESVCLFRDALSDVLAAELGPRLTASAGRGWDLIIEHIGTEILQLRGKCADYLRILASSWAVANSRRAEDEEEEGPSEASEQLLEGSTTMAASATSKAASVGRRASFGESPRAGQHSPRSLSRRGSFGDLAAALTPRRRNSEVDPESANVPTGYTEMFYFNAAIMGVGECAWMSDVVSSFSTLVANAANLYRLQEECDVLGLRLVKYRGRIHLGEYKAVMLSSLRSLVSKEWNSRHEVAWCWLWDNIARLLKIAMSNARQMDKAVQRLWGQLSEQETNMMRRDLYNHFFAQSPAGQEYFKQSTTRLYYISDLVRSLTLEMYKRPRKAVEDISGIGLRHVGYGIPVDLIGPYVTAWVHVVRKVAGSAEDGEQGFRWALNLLARIMTRVIAEGSTVVMMAINANSAKMLRRAVGAAPRGKRACWLLNVQVGMQRISPFMWALESGSLETAAAIIRDLLTIRADRERYYYGVDALFERHPDVIQRLSIDAPSLLPALLDGLIWRSRTTERGMRRVNYYVKHLIVDSKGNFSKAVEWLTDGGDPKIACHPVVSVVIDLVWSGVAYRIFLAGKTWLLFCVAVFVVAQSVLNRWEDVYLHPGLDGTHMLVDHNPLEIRLTVFLMRVFLYTCSMGRLIHFHVRHIYKEYRAGQVIPLFGVLKMPSYLVTWQNKVSLLLAMALMLMFIQCPVLYCFANSDSTQMFAQRCEGSKHLLLPYSIYSAVAMVLYFLLLTDVAALSTRVSAFVLVCGRALSEVVLFISGVLFTAVTFAAAISSLEQFNSDFAGMPQSMLSLLRITLGIFDGDGYWRLSEYPALLVLVCVYVVGTAGFLTNVLVAQLNCLYRASYEDLLGYSRLNRGRILVETVPKVRASSWSAFVASLDLGSPIDFGEGDIGVAGGVQVFEPGIANPTPADMIQRFGGSTSASAPWPDTARVDEDGRLERLERILEQSASRLAKLLNGGGGQRGGGRPAASDPGEAHAAPGAVFADIG